MPKTTTLYVGQSIMFAHEAWAEFEKHFMYDLRLEAQVIEALSMGGKYSKIDGIIRPNLDFLRRALIARLYETSVLLILKARTLYAFLEIPARHASYARGFSVLTNLGHASI